MGVAEENVGSDDMEIVRGVISNRGTGAMKEMVTGEMVSW